MMTQAIRSDTESELKTERFATRQLLILAAMLVGMILLSFALALGQTSQPIEDKTIDRAIQAEIIDSVMEALNEVYVFPDVAKQMDNHVRSKLKDGDYKGITSTREFVNRLTQDLQEISHDRHLHVDYLTDAELEEMTAEEVTDEMRENWKKRDQRNNYGFRDVKILKGNVGYVKFDGFSGSPNARTTAVAAMNFVGYADAVIFDLRQNGGGSPAMIQLLSSYLLEDRTHLNSFYVRKTDSIEQFWSTVHVDGPRMDKTDVYVLTSPRTFSAAEEFTYNLKNLKRATIVGETTGGGAHPVEGNFWANLNVQMSLPYGRAINPITGTNWEGTGITPDIDVPAAEALDVAHYEALKKIAERATDEHYKMQLDWAISDMDARMHPLDIDVSRLAHYAGQYGPRQITWEEGSLYYQRGDNPRMKMIPMSEILFRFDEIDYFRLEVVTDESGQPVELVGHYDNGTMDSHRRDSAN